MARPGPDGRVKMRIDSWQNACKDRASGYEVGRLRTAGFSKSGDLAQQITNPRYRDRTAGVRSRETSHSGVDHLYQFEVGGKSKSKRQIRNQDNSYLVVDDVEYGMGTTIPLWLFGFLY